MKKLSQKPKQTTKNKPNEETIPIKRTNIVTFIELRHSTYLGKMVVSVRKLTKSEDSKVRTVLRC